MHLYQHDTPRPTGLQDHASALLGTLFETDRNEHDI